MCEGTYILYSAVPSICNRSWIEHSSKKPSHYFIFYPPSSVSVYLHRLPTLVCPSIANNKYITYASYQTLLANIVSLYHDNARSNGDIILPRSCSNMKFDFHNKPLHLVLGPDACLCFEHHALEQECRISYLPPAVFLFLVARPVCFGDSSRLSNKQSKETWLCLRRWHGPLHNVSQKSLNDSHETACRKFRSGACQQLIPR